MAAHTNVTMCCTGHIRHNLLSNLPLLVLFFVVLSPSHSTCEVPFSIYNKERHLWVVPLQLHKLLISIAGNSNLLYLGAALNNSHHPGIPQVALYRVFAATAQRTMNLYDIFGGFHADARGEILCDKCL